MKRNTSLLWMTMIAAALALSACGGGGDESSGTAVPATAAVPPEASQSIGGLIEYLKALVTSSADTLEPVDVGAVTPPVDDRAEPTSVD